MPRTREPTISDRLPGSGSVSEIMTVLGHDFTYLATKMVASAKRGTLTEKDATHARRLIRALFALVEGVTHALKVVSLELYPVQGHPLPEGVREIVSEKGYGLGDEGKIVRPRLKLTWDRKVKFAFQFFADTYAATNPLETKSDWWRALKRCEGVRHRLTHPRSAEDLKLSADAIVDAVEAERGFRQAVDDLNQTSGQVRPAHAPPAGEPHAAPRALATRRDPRRRGRTPRRGPA